MRTLYHLPPSAPCRIVRLALAEKGLPFELTMERVWERRPEFLALNPAGEVPVLVEEDGTAVADLRAICEYLDEVYPETPLIGATVLGRAETRRLLAWFDLKFAREVTDNLVGEKLIKRLSGLGQPESAAIRAGLANVHYHMDYIAWLAEQRRWLAGDGFGLADIAAAAHLSAVDYLGNVPWDDHPEAKLWYARMKSRPSFRPLLGDQVTGVTPPPHYADLDF
jgi:glutathione S-transferase